MTVNEHLNAVCNQIPSMTTDELSNLIASISQLKSDAEWNLKNKLHSQHAHRPYENNLD